MTYTHRFTHPHLLSIEQLSRPDIALIFERAEAMMTAQAAGAPPPTLAGKTVVNLFFENSTRTMASFEIAARRLGAIAVNMPVAASSVVKGETLIDTAVTLNAMGPDALVIRHSASGGAQLLSRKVDCPVLNAGDGWHQHPTQGLLDALTLQRAAGSVEGLRIVICGDIVHSRVARSTALTLHVLGARVTLCGPPTLIPSSIEGWGAEAVTPDFDAALEGADVLMMLRLQAERMEGAYLPSRREYAWAYGLTPERVARAAPDVLVMHPGPMNRGVEIVSSVADGPASLIAAQVETGVALRMALLDLLAGEALR